MTTKTERLSARTTPELKETLSLIAQKKNITLAVAINQAVQLYIAKWSELLK